MSFHPPCPLLVFYCSISLLFPDCHAVEIIQCVALSYWLLSLINMHFFSPVFFCGLRAHFFLYWIIFHCLSTAVYWRRKWQPTPVLLPGKFHGWRSLVGYNPWGHKELDSTEWLHFLSFYSSFWRGKWQPTPVFLPGKSHGQRGLVGYSLWGCKESDMTKQLTHTAIYPLTYFRMFSLLPSFGNNE